jgi:uroporphyrinogen-III decarboxylase
MTGKERVLRTLRREPVDRVPVSTYQMAGCDPELWFNQQPSYAKLMEFINETTDWICGCWYGRANLALEEIQTEEKWQEGELIFKRVTIHTPKGDLTSLRRDQRNLHTTWITEHLLKSMSDLEKWLSIPYEPDEVDVGRIRKSEERIGEKGIVSVGLGDPILTIADLFSFQDFLLNWATHRARILHAMDVIFERQYAELKELLDLGAGPLFCIVGPEYATPPYVPPDDFRELVVRYDKRLIELIHDHGGFVRIHCHGNVGKVLAMFVEMGADGADPVEAPPSGDIELAEVKKLYGDDLVIFGNIQMRDLEYAAPDEMDELVRKCMESAKEGGGYVLMPTTVPIKAPLEPQTDANYRVFIEAGLKYGSY